MDSTKAARDWRAQVGTPALVVTPGVRVLAFLVGGGEGAIQTGKGVAQVQTGD